MNQGAMVAWILIPAFVAVGLYLVWYAKRRKQMVESFANVHQLRMCPQCEAQIQAELDANFELEEEGLVRSFGQLSTLVNGDDVWIFRAIELLDLDSHAQSYTTHFPRIAAMFDVSASHGEFFVLDLSGQHHQILPQRSSPDPNVIEIVRRIVKECTLGHTLSVTLSGGHGLIYLEPLVVGGETIADVNTLYCIAKKMRVELTGDD